MIILEEQIYQREIAAIDLRYQQSLNNTKAQIDQWEQEIKAKSLQQNALYEKARKEADGTGGSMQRNAGPIYQLKKADADRAQTELSNLEARLLPLISNKETELDSLQKAKILGDQWNQKKSPGWFSNPIRSIEGFDGRKQRYRYG